MNMLLNLRQKTTRTVKYTGITAAFVFLFLTSFTFQQTEWKAPESAKGIKNPIPADAASIAAGKVLYTKECLQCHGRKGLGDGPNSTTLEKSPAAINNTAKVKNQTDGELFWKIKEGRKPMPSTKKNFTDEQRWQVINYIRTLSK